MQSNDCASRSCSENITGRKPSPAHLQQTSRPRRSNLSPSSCLWRRTSPPRRVTKTAGAPSSQHTRRNNPINGDDRLSQPHCQETPRRRRGSHRAQERTATASDPFPGYQRRRAAPHPSGASIGWVAVDWVAGCPKFRPAAGKQRTLLRRHLGPSALSPLTLHRFLADSSLGANIVGIGVSTAPEGADNVRRERNQRLIYSLPSRAGNPTNHRTPTEISTPFEQIHPSRIPSVDGVTYRTADPRRKARGGHTTRREDLISTRHKRWR